MRDEMTKRERVTAAFRDEAYDRTPVCFWWHFPGDLPEEEIVARHLAFFRDTREDMLKITSDGFFG